MQGGLPPGAHMSRSFTPGANSPLCLQLSPAAMCTRSRAGKRGGFLPLAPGRPWDARALLSARRLRHRHTPGTDRQSGTFPRPPWRNRSPLSPLSARGSWALPLPTAGSGTGCLELFVTSLWGPAGEGSAWHGATSPICWKQGLGGRNCCRPHGPVCPTGNAKSCAEWGCSAPVSPCLLPTSHAASPRSGPTTTTQFPRKQKAFIFVRRQRQESSCGKEKKDEKGITKSEETVCAVLHH